MASVFKRSKSLRQTYQVAFRDAYGIRRVRSTRTTSRQLAEQIAKKWEADALLRAEGIIDRDAELRAQRAAQPIEAVLTQYDCDLEYDRVIKAICVQANFVLLRDIQAPSIIKAFTDIQEHGLPGFRHRSLPLSNTTINNYIDMIHRFTRWLVKFDQLPDDPLESLKKLKTQKIYKRRMLLPDELDWMRETKSIDGQRLLLYAVAIQTGYRSKEIKSLRVADLVNDPTQPFIRCDATRTKNRKPAKQYISLKLAHALATMIKSRRCLPNASLFDIPADTAWAEMLRCDVAAARKRYLDEGGDAESDFLLPTNHAGEVLDFHSLRHTCGAWLALNGVSPKVVQSIMRHTKPETTFDTYGHLMPGAEAVAVDAFPPLDPGGHRKPRLAAS